MPVARASSRRRLASRPLMLPLLGSEGRPAGLYIRCSSRFCACCSGRTTYAPGRKHVPRDTARERRKRTMDAKKDAVSVVDLAALAQESTIRQSVWAYQSADLNVNLLVWGADEGVVEHVNSE